MAETEPEDDQIARAIVAHLAADLVMAAFDEEGAQLVVEPHANRADEAGIARAIHEQPQRLCHEGFDLLGRDDARITVVKPRIVDDRVHDLAILFDKRRGNGAPPIERLGNLRKTHRKSSARCFGVHAAFSRRSNEPPSSSSRLRELPRAALELGQGARLRVAGQSRGERRIMSGVLSDETLTETAPGKKEIAVISARRGQSPARRLPTPRHCRARRRARAASRRYRQLDAEIRSPGPPCAGRCARQDSRRSARSGATDWLLLSISRPRSTSFRRRVRSPSTAAQKRKPSADRVEQVSRPRRRQSSHRARLRHARIEHGIIGSGQPRIVSRTQEDRLGLPSHETRRPLAKRVSA